MLTWTILGNFEKPIYMILKGEKTHEMTFLWHSAPRAEEIGRESGGPTKVPLSKYANSLRLIASTNFKGLFPPFCLFVYYLDLSANLVQKCSMHYIFNSVSWESICVHNSHQLRMCDASALKKTWGHQKAIVANDTSLGLLCLSLSHS